MNIKTSFTTCLASICVAASMSGCSALSHHKATGNPDKRFVLDAAMASNAEIEASQLALKTSKKSDVREFAAEMIRDHQKAIAKLEPVASALGLRLPAMADPTHMMMGDHLENVPADRFDGEYLGQMTADHAMVVSKFEHASNNADNASVKTYAAGQLPALKHHYEMAQSLEKKYCK